MTINCLNNVLETLKESCFYKAERTRLHYIYQRINQHKTSCKNCIGSKKDLITHAHELAAKDDYHKLLEHYGTEFWTNYFEGEHPTCILDHSLDKHLPYRNFQEQKLIAEYELTPCNFWRK